jgi:glycosyltransferase 2 family protein
MHYLGLIVSLFFLYLVFRGTDINRILQTLSAIKPLYAVTVAVLSVFLVAFKTLRWKMILDKFDVISYKKLFSINMIAHMFNILLPLRAGEVFQIFITKSNTNAKSGHTKIAGTIVLNKFFELLSLLILCYLLTWFVAIPPSWLVPVRLLVVFVFGFLLLFAFNIIDLRKISVPKNRFLRIAYDFFMSLKLLEDKVLLIKALLMSMFIWSIELLMINLLFMAFNLVLPVWVSIFIIVSINLAMLIPATNASFGPYEYAIILVLSMYSVSKDVALSFALTFHFLEVILVLAGGLFYYLRIKRKTPA